MGDRACCTAEASTAVAMKVFMVLALAAGQINSQESGSGHGNMDGMSGSGMGSGMEGSGYGGYGMGGSGFGGEWSGSGYGGDWMNFGAGECCPTKKIRGSRDWEKDGIYDLVLDG